MKKFLALFFCLAILTACSKDDDNDENDGPDPILGTWVLVEASSPLDGFFCADEESIITFNENNTGEATFYLTTTECSANESEGNWKNEGDSVYTITVPVLGSLEGTANFTSATRFTFSTNVAGIPGVLTFEKQ